MNFFHQRNTIGCKVIENSSFGMTPSLNVHVVVRLFHIEIANEKYLLKIICCLR